MNIMMLKSKMNKESAMFYVVPQKRSILKAEAKFEVLIDAQRHALKLRKETGKQYDIFHYAPIWSTTEFKGQ